MISELNNYFESYRNRVSLSLEYRCVCTRAFRALNDTVDHMKDCPDQLEVTRRIASLHKQLRDEGLIS